MELYENLTRLRQEAGLSQQELAEKLNVSRQSISKWEVGTALPSTDNLIRLSRLYRVSLDYLVGNTETVEQEAPDSADGAVPAVKVPEDCAERPGHSRRAVLDRILLVILSLAVVGLSVALVRAVKAGAPKEILPLEEMDRGVIDPSDFEEDFSIGDILNS